MRILIVNGERNNTNITDGFVTEAAEEITKTFLSISSFLFFAGDDNMPQSFFESSAFASTNTCSQSIWNRANNRIYVLFFVPTRLTNNAPLPLFILKSKGKWSVLRSVVIISSFAARFLVSSPRLATWMVT